MIPKLAQTVQDKGSIAPVNNRTPNAGPRTAEARQIVYGVAATVGYSYRHIGIILGGDGGVHQLTVFMD
jgi:hypothetical protein